MASRRSRARFAAASLAVAAGLWARVFSAGAASWTSTTPLPDAYLGHVCAYAAGHLYQAGGVSYNGGVTDGRNSFYAPVSGGVVGQWTAGPLLPEPLFYHAGTTVNGFFYVFGGYHYSDADGYVVSAAVYYAKINADASLGSWQTANSLPHPEFLPSAAVWNDRIYMTGGGNNSGLTNAVYSAKVRADGSLEPWTAQKSLPDAIYTHAAVSNGTLYVLGGVVDGGNVIQNTVYYSTIGADGALAGWATTTGLPVPLSSHGSVVANGRAFVMGGWTGAGPTDAVHSAAAFGSDGLGDWSPEAPLPMSLYLHAVAVSGSHIFVTGGSDTQNMQRSVYTLPLPPPPPPADNLPPRTSLAFGSPLYGDAPFIAPTTPAVLSAVDDATTVGDGVGVGVASTQWAVDDGAFAAYEAPIRISNDGTHWIRFLSVDTLGHAEAARAVSIAVDGTAPSSTLAVGSPQAVLTTGELVVGTSTLLSASAADPAVNGVASGVARLLAGVDGAALAPIAKHFSLPAADGAYTVTLQALDNVQNAEAPRTVTLYVDGTAPVTALATTPAPYQPAGGAPILAAAALLSLTAQDPKTGAIAAGIHHTETALDGGPFTVYVGAFGLAEGAHDLAYRSIDNVGNVEAARAVSYRVDSTPPQSTFAAAAGTSLFGVDMITPETSLTITAADPVSSGVASGVARIVYGIDGGSTQVYAGPFRLPAGDHVLRYAAVDNAGNIEDQNTIVLSVGTFLADALAGIDSVSLVGGTTVVGAVRSNGAFMGKGKSSVTGDVTAMSVSLNGKSTISGTIAQGQATLPPAAYDLTVARAAAQTRNNNAAIPAQFLAGGALVLSHRQALTLPTGDYYLTGLTLKGRARLSVAGRVNLFLDGPLTLRAGSSLNDAGQANDMWIINAYAGRAAHEEGDGEDDEDEDVQRADSHSAAHGVCLTGKIRAAFNLYAPLSAVALSGHGEIAGRLLGKAVSMSGKVQQPSMTALAAWVHEPKPPKPIPAPPSRKDGDTASLVASSRPERSSPPASAPRRKAVSVALQAPTTPAPTSSPAAESGSTPKTPKAPKHLPVPPSSPSGGTATAVASSRLERTLPPASASHTEAINAAAPAPQISPPALAARTTAGSRTVAQSRKVASSPPPLSLSGRAVFAIVGGGGGAVRTKDRSAVVIPDGATTSGLGVTVAPPQAAETVEVLRRGKVSAEKGLIEAAAGVQFGPEGTRFAKPVTLELPYDRTRLPAGVAEISLAVHYWNPDRGDWERLASSVDTVNQVVRAQTTHFSLYQVFSGGAAPAADNDPAFAMRAVYTFPNPARGQNSVTIRIQPGLADSVEVRVYDLSGRKVHESSDFSLSNVNDGNGLGEQLTYDHVWSVSDMGSGVYNYVVSARKAGFAGVGKTGKIGVVK